MKTPVTRLARQGGTPRIMFMHPEGGLAQLEPKKFYSTMVPILCIPWDDASRAALRFALSKVCLYKTWPLWQRLEKADEVIAALSKPAPGSRGRKGKT